VSEKAIIVSLRPLQFDDQKAVTELNARPEVQSRLGGIGDPNGFRNGYLQAVLANGEFAGVVGLLASQALEGNDLELICALLKRFEGQGIAVAACRMVLEPSDAKVRAQRVLACIAPDNTDGQALATRLGFTPLGIARQMSVDEIWEYDSTSSPARHNTL
jgi:RimJ/RimL family protein N-acetyltransferase